MLDRIGFEVINIYNGLKSRERDITVDVFRNLLSKGSNDTSKFLNECCEIYNSSIDKQIGIEIGKITFGRYSTFPAILKCLQR